jgi:hypothetical protein
LFASARCAARTHLARFGEFLGFFWDGQEQETFGFRPDGRWETLRRGAWCLLPGARLRTYSSTESTPNSGAPASSRASFKVLGPPPSSREMGSYSMSPLLTEVPTKTITSTLHGFPHQVSTGAARGPAILVVVR